MRLVQVFFQNFIRCLVGNLGNAPLTVHDGAPVHDDECQVGAPVFRLLIFIPQYFRSYEGIQAHAFISGAGHLYNGAVVVRTLTAFRETKFN